MKTLFKTASLLLLSTALSFGGFTVPKTIYKMSELDEAKAEAAEEGEHLLIIYSNPGTT